MAVTATVVIPHAGSPSVAAAVASAAAAALRLGEPAEILVVDDRPRRNGASPLPHAAAGAPSVRTVRTRGAAGFAAAANAGLAAASSDLVLLLNDDATLDPDALAALLAAADAHPEAGAFQAKILSVADGGMFDYAGGAGGMMDRYGYPFCMGRVLFRTERDCGRFDEERPVFWTSGCAMLLRRDAALAAGGLWEGFGMHMEEIDLCWRLWRRGVQCRSVPQAVVRHAGGGTLPAASLRKPYLNHRNHWLLLARNMPRRSLAAAAAVRAGLDAAELLWSLATLRWRNAAAVAAADAWALLSPRALLRARRDADGPPRALPGEAPVYPGSMVLAALRGASSGELAARCGAAGPAGGRDG